MYLSDIGGGAGIGGAGGTVAPSNENLGGTPPLHVSVPKYVILQIKEPCAKLSTNSCHQHATRRGSQTAKIVFDITCGIGDFRACIFCPPLTQELPKKHQEAGSFEQVPTHVLSQIDYGHTMDT